MARNDNANPNKALYHFVCALFMLAAAVEGSFVYAAIGLCFLLLAYTKRKGKKK